MDQNQIKLNEALSALMDGEADELELRRILRELSSSPELYAAWQRYHTVRASLHQDIHRDPAVDLLQGFHARLAAEQNAGEFGHQSLGRFGSVIRSRFVRYLGQGAIAASVAVAALMGFSVLQTADTGTSAPAAVEVAVTGTTPALNGEFNGGNNGGNEGELSRTVSVDAEAYSRLEQAVYRGLSELPPPELTPVNYNPEFPVQTAPAE